MAIDQGQSQSSQLGVGSKQSLFGRIAGDFRAGKRFIAAKAQGRSLAHKKQETEGQLLASFQKVGDQAASLGIGTHLPSFQQVQTQREQLATAEAALQDKAAATKRAEADLAAEMQRHSGVVSPLEAELKPLMAAMAAAQQSLEAIQRDARSIDAQTNKVKADLANPPQGTAAVSPEELRRTLSGLEESKRAIEPRQTEANKQHGQAKQMADAKAAQVSAAKQELNKAKSKGEADVATAKAAETEATKAVGAGKIALTRSLQSFGKAVFEANTSDPKLATDTAQAKTLIAEIADMDTKIKLADAEAAASKGGTTRAAIYVGGALVVIVVLVLILSATLGGGSNRGTADSEANRNYGPGSEPRIVGTWTKPWDDGVSYVARFTKDGTIIRSQSGRTDGYTGEQVSKYSADKGTLTTDAFGFATKKHSIEFLSDDEMILGGSSSDSGTWKRVKDTPEAALEAFFADVHGAWLGVPDENVRITITKDTVTLSDGSDSWSAPGKVDLAKKVITLATPDGKDTLTVKLTDKTHLACLFEKSNRALAFRRQGWGEGTAKMLHEKEERQQRLAEEALRAMGRKANGQ